VCAFFGLHIQMHLTVCYSNSWHDALCSCKAVDPKTLSPTATSWRALRRLRRLHAHQPANIIGPDPRIDSRFCYQAVPVASGALLCRDDLPLAFLAVAFNFVADVGQLAEQCLRCSLGYPLEPTPVPLEVQHGNRSTLVSQCGKLALIFAG
jgi:hypothetical protein